MDDKLESFACRMGRRRVSLRNDHDRNGILNSLANRDLQRRYNILKAIDDTHIHRQPDKGMADRDKLDQTFDYCSPNVDGTKIFINNNNNEKSTDCYNKGAQISEASPGRSSTGLVSYVKSFELGRVKWRGPLANNYLTKSSGNFKRLEDFSGGHSLSTNESKFQESAAKSSNVGEGNINASSKMIASLKNVDNTSGEMYASNMSEMSQSSMYSLSSLSAVIDDLDAQIKALEIEQENTANTEPLIELSDRIYPVIEDMKFEPTGWTPQLKCKTRDNTSEITDTERFTRNVESKYVADFSSRPTTRGRPNKPSDKDASNGIGTYYETPKKVTKKIPIMESTRKSLHSDSTKIKFPTPTRTESTISTIALPITPADSPKYKYHNAEESNDNTLDMTTPFEVDQFLQDALGDELYNTTVTYDATEDRDITNSQFNVSDLVSEEETPLRKRLVRDIRPPATEPPRGTSNTLNRSMGLCRTLSQRIKKKFRSAIKTKQDLPSPPKISKVGPESDIIGQLLQEVSVQQMLMNQASKALNVCQTMKEFMESSERVESDRVLLVAGLRRTAALEEIKRVSSQESRKQKEFLGAKGEITIKDLTLNLRECLKSEPQEGETVDWFVVVVSSGLKVWATHAMSCPIYNLRIDFPEIISIPNLMPNFKILIQVYSLKLRSATYNHEDKYRIRRMKRSTSCPPFLVTSPTKFLKKTERPLSPKLHRTNPPKDGYTCFVLSGFVELFLQDLSLSSPWPLMLVPENSILDRTIDLSLACRLHLSMSHEGFLTHGDEAGGLASWNRRWCVLKGHTLMLWNYPRDQETKDPLTVIELVNCVSNKIATANRKICAKPKTLLIETVRRRNLSDRDSIVFECRSSCTIVRNFLSCDSVHELVEWSTKLNHIVLALREWNVIGTRPPEVSDL